MIRHSAAAILIALPVVLGAAPSPKSETLKGYLMPFKCQNDDKATHSRTCALRPECLITGYGLTVDDGMFVQFDGESNKKAIRLLRQATKETGLRAEAEGYRSGSLFHVTALRLQQVGG